MEWTIEIKRKKLQVLLGLGLVLFFIWFIRSPIAASEIEVHEVKQSGDKLIIDGTFKDKLTRYKGYSLKHYGTGEVVVKIYGGIIGSRDIHIETDTIKNNRVIYLYTPGPGEDRANQVWP